MLVLFTAWHGLSATFLEADLAVVAKEVQVVQAENGELKRAAEQRLSQLRTDLERLRREQIERSELVAILSGYESKTGFSGHLMSLARSHVDGLWLNEIRIVQSDGSELPQVQLKGSATHPQRVPDYLHSIADDRYFAGQRFDRFRLDISEEDGLVLFELVGPANEDAG